MLPLADLERRFLAAIAPGSETAPASDQAPIDAALLGLVNARGGLGPAERIAIYADMYRARLVDVMREDFPRVLRTVGDEVFSTLVSRYLARHPSTNPSVRHLGRRFAEFLAGERTTPPFLADLARLEWARVEVFDAPDAEPLSLSDLEPILPSEWPMLRFRLIPACAVVESTWPVHEIWAAADDGADGRRERWEPRPTTVRVWREGWSVSHAAMGAAEQLAFRVLDRGESFASLCASLEGDLDAEAAAREVGGLLMRWLEDGLLGPLAA
jgi:hypothetical protein